MQLKSLLCVLVLAGVAYAVPAQEKRVHHHADLSDHVHDDAHGFQYDHEAFLGKEEAKTFDQLTPEESKDKLAWVFQNLHFSLANQTSVAAGIENCLLQHSSVVLNVGCIFL